MVGPEDSLNRMNNIFEEESPFKFFNAVKSDEKQILSDEYVCLWQKLNDEAAKTPTDTDTDTPTDTDTESDTDTPNDTDTSNDTDTPTDNEDPNEKYRTPTVDPRSF